MAHDNYPKGAGLGRDPNPLICDDAADTLYQVSCCLAFISRVHADLADWKIQEDGRNTYGPDEMTSEEHRGLFLLLECVRSAVDHETKRKSA